MRGSPESEGLIQETFDYLLSGARGALEKGASYIPFGAAVRIGGQRIHMNLDPAVHGKTAEEQIAGLVAALRADPGLTCAGLCFDGAVGLESGESVSAVCMHIEVKNGESLEAFVPYVREPGGLVVMQPVFAPADPEIFTAR